MPFLEKKRTVDETPLNVARFKAMFSHKVVKKHG